MINNKRILCIITARKNSKGLSDKNIKKLNGKPLVSWPILTGLESKYVDDVIVSTDCNNISDIAKNYGAEVPFIRPANLAEDDSLSSDVILHALSFDMIKSKNYDYFVLLEPTSPLTESTDVDAALERVIENKYSSLVSITKVTGSHPSFCVELSENNTIIPFDKKSIKNIARRQDVRPLYNYDGSLYVSNVKEFIKNKSLFHDKTAGFVMPSWKSIEIDSLLDFYIVETILKNKAEISEASYET